MSLSIKRPQSSCACRTRGLEGWDAHQASRKRMGQRALQQLPKPKLFTIQLMRRQAIQPFFVSRS